LNGQIKAGGKMKTSLVLLMTLVSLSAWAEDLAGHYVLEDVMEVGSELLLKTDGRFEYMLAYGAADYWAKGTWRHEKDQVILNSDGKKEAPFKFLRSEVGKPGRICVWVKGENGQGAEDINVVLQAGAQHFEAATTSEGAAEFPDVAGASAVFFEVRVYSIEAGPFNIDPSNKDFYFEINGDAITQVLFKYQPLDIDGKALVMKYWNEQSPIRYERQ
jgi:hypothetical protein